MTQIETKDGPRSYNLYGATKSSTDETGNPYAYNGEVRDSTGLDYLRARYYDSQAGTFLTEDSYQGELADPLSQNRYSYVQNNPVNYTDPSGPMWNPLQQLWNGAKKLGNNLWNGAKSLYHKTESLVGNLWNAGQNLASRSWDKLTSFVSGGKSSSSGHPSRQSGPRFVRNQSYSSYQWVTGNTYHPQRTVLNRWQEARVSGLSTYNWGTSKTREAQNIDRNWSKSLEETIRHVCDPKTTKARDKGGDSRTIDKTKLSNIAIVTAIAVTSGIGLVGLLGSQGKKKKADKVFGKGSVEVEYPENELLTKNGWYSVYQKTKISSEIDGGGMFNLTWTNGWQPSINLKIGGVEGTVGLSGRNLELSGSISSGDSKKLVISENASISVGLDGIDYSTVKRFENENGGVGMGNGLNLNLDTKHGVLGGYHIQESISRRDSSTVTTQTQTGARIGDGKQLAVIAIGIAVPQLLPLIPGIAPVLQYMP